MVLGQCPREERMEQSQFSERLRQAMGKAHLKQADLVRMAAERGEKLGKSQLSQYVSGKVTPRREALGTLAGLLGVPAEWLAGQQDVAAAKPRVQVQVHTERERTMREFKKSSKLDHVLYDVRGPVVDEAARMEAEASAFSSSTSATLRRSAFARRTRS